MKYGRITGCFQQSFSSSLQSILQSTCSDYDNVYSNQEIMIQWLCKKFDDLNPHELYGILQLRNAVFVVEQNCVFQDADDKDQFSHHVICIDDHKVIAYARIVPPGISYVETSIGRVVTSPLRRAEGLGKLLMEKSIEAAYHLYGKTVLKIGAQLYLKKFYESFGFEQTSDVYIEDDIPHIEMML